MLALEHEAMLSMFENIEIVHIADIWDMGLQAGGPCDHQPIRSLS